MRVEFVNLGRIGQGMLAVAARLAASHHDQGRRVLILARDQFQAEEADRALWTFDPASFLPHALAGGENQAQEPVLIGLGIENINHAKVLIAVAPVEPGQAGLTAFEHLIEFVPAQEGPDLVAARGRYKKWQLSGVELVHTTRLPG